MSVATDFRKWLLSQSTVTALVANRVCQLNMQQTKETPYIVFHRTGGKPGEVDLDGEGGIEETALGVEIHGEQGQNVEAIYVVLAGLINGFPQSDLTGSNRKWNGRTIQYAGVVDVGDDYQYLPAASDAVVQRVAMIVEVMSDG